MDVEVSFWEYGKFQSIEDIWSFDNVLVSRTGPLTRKKTNRSFPGVGWGWRLASIVLQANTEGQQFPQV
jgi:hypothetical protein